MKRIGLLITTYNRPAYLRQTLASLKEADLSGISLLIVDDCSRSSDTRRLISDYRRIELKENKGIAHALRIGFDRLIKEGAEVVMNLDPDTLVRRDFIKVLMALHERFEGNIISGFNTLTKSKQTGKPRHPIVSEGDGYVTKKTIGGISMMMHAKIYGDIVRPALLRSQNGEGQWDYLTCEAAGVVIVSKPSVIQHIGFSSAMIHNDNPDVADDFVQKEKLCVLQPRGLGDIIYCMRLIESFMDRYDVTWPVMPEWLDGLRRAYPDISWLDVRDSPVPITHKRDSIVNGYRALPIRWSDTIQKVPYAKVMRAKYDIYRKNYLSWKAKWVRDEVKEDALMGKLGIKSGEYVLKNVHFSQGEIKIEKYGVMMREIPGFSLFDWAKVIEGAKEIHTVSTSVLFLIAQLKTGPVYVYLRDGDKDHRNYAYLFKGDGRFIFM